MDNFFGPFPGSFWHSRCKMKLKVKNHKKKHWEKKTIKLGLLLTALWDDATRRGMKRWLVDSPTDQHCILTFDKYKYKKHVFLNLENTNVKREITFDKYKYKNISYSSIIFLLFAMLMYWTWWSLFENDWENIFLQENTIDRQCILDISFFENIGQESLCL